jgi:alkaline phosphatase D
VVDSRDMSRRTFVRLLGLGAAGSAFLPLQAFGQSPSPVVERPTFAANPFTLGVASGDPLPEGVVLWTRLAPDPLHGGGMPPNPVRVEWEVAADEGFRQIVRQGAEVADPDLGHSVHAEVNGLAPGRWYWYRFKAGSEISRAGRTRTAPPAGALAYRLRFAFASCQHYETGYHTAYHHMAAEDLDLVVHLGDYIYEGGATTGKPRMHNGPEPVSIVDYRNRHALYRSDPNLQEAHAAFPWIVTWDDHKVDNNYAGAIPQDPEVQTTPQFLAKRAAAYHVYYEMMPLRRSALPSGPDMQLYRRLAFGGLAQFNVLDTRQYRSDQPCGDGTKARCEAALSPGQTMTGPEQERWVLDGLGRSQARWNILAQQVVMAQLELAPGPDKRYSMDKWDGYVAARDRILGFVRSRPVQNFVVLSGDIHQNWAAELKANFDDPGSATLGAEYVGTSISSDGDGSDTLPTTATTLAENPHLKFFNSQRGYVRCEVTPSAWRSDYRVVPYVSQPGAPISTRASFVTENGKPGVTPTAART